MRNSHLARTLAFRHSQDQRVAEGREPIQRRKAAKGAWEAQKAITELQNEFNDDQVMVDLLERVREIFK